jgi:hypothetical protein
MSLRLILLLQGYGGQVAMVDRPPRASVAMQLPSSLPCSESTPQKNCCRKSLK